MKTWVKILISAAVFAAVALILYFLLVKSGFLARFESVKQFREYIRSFGGWGVVIYILSGILLLMFIPNFIIWSVGYACFGWWTLLWSYIIICVAAMLFFFLGRIGGTRWVYWVFGKEPVDKLLDKIAGKDFWVLFVVYLLPFTPDNLLSVCAGMTKIKWENFALMLLSVRAVTIATNILITSGIFGIIF